MAALPFYINTELEALLNKSFGILKGCRISLKVKYGRNIS
jgi:hypothetical protein